ncbi:MAG: ATP-binding cassette domain-containing protein, partial [Verrucomicrobiota bacterium]
FLRRYVVWARAGDQARPPKQKKRLDRFQEVSEQSGPETELNVQLVLPPPSPLGNIIVHAENVGIALGGKSLFQSLDLEFAPASCTGIIGRNGLGKTSLLRILMGQLEPDSGSVRIGTKTEFNYADQNRLAVDGSKNMIQEVGEGSEFIEFGNQRLHINSYLKRFLFQDEQLQARIDTLSGGERNRVMLAKLLRHGGNFLILDEPTNDLDLATLRVLEEAILAFSGVVLVVSHDRYFLDRVADRIIAFEGEESVFIQDGDYSYYAEKRKERRSRQVSSPTTAPAKSTTRPKRERSRKLSYREAQELDGMEATIQSKEERIEAAESQLNDPEFYQTQAERAGALHQELETLRSEVEALYSRWEDLEAIRTGSS